MASTWMKQSMFQVLCRKKEVSYILYLIAFMGTSPKVESLTRILLKR